MDKSPRILIAPLDWGLGHATRCVPIIRELALLGVTPVLGGSGNSLKLLQEEFPELESIALPDYKVTYPENGNMVGHFLFDAPRLLRKIGLENQVLQKLISEKQLNGIISDSRFGLFTKRVPTVFITHQLWIRSPFLQGFIRYLNRQYIQRFGACWIPDFPGEDNLAGALSHPMLAKPECHYIGPLSRFQAPVEQSLAWDHIALVSGPEPQRGKLEMLLEEQLAVLPGKHLLVCGIPGPKTERQSGNLTVYNHLPTAELESAIAASGHVICRSGYSSLMDLAVLGKPALLIPTPGQTEQEFLADLARERSQYHAVNQDQLHLENDLAVSKKMPGKKVSADHHVLRQQLEAWLATIPTTA